MALVDFKGFRLLAELGRFAQLQLVYGSCEAAKRCATFTQNFASTSSASAQRLVSAHRVHDASLYTGVDCEGHFNKENGRYYLLDLARLFPPESPLEGEDIMSRQLRPNFVTNYSHTKNVALNSDAFTKLGDFSEDDAEVDVATTFMLTTTIDPLHTLEHKDTLSARDVALATHTAGVNMRHLGVLWSKATTQRKADHRHRDGREGAKMHHTQRLQDDDGDPRGPAVHRRCAR